MDHNDAHILPANSSWWSNKRSTAYSSFLCEYVHYQSRSSAFESEIFFEQRQFNDIEHKVMNKRCKLLCNVEHGRLGQAEIEQSGASIVINVKPEFENESFSKDEYALVFRKDDQDVYYIGKLLLSNDFYNEMEEI